jgi:23S rRNA A2030 N6-methylase RlmJ
MKKIQYKTDQNNPIIRAYVNAVKAGNQTEELSNCCGARILMNTFCAECKEHCK